MLDAQESTGHLEIVGRLIETERADANQELFGNPGDRDVVDVDLLLTEQGEEQIEWSAELRELDDEARGVAGGVTACGRHHAARLRQRRRVECRGQVNRGHVKNPFSHGAAVGSNADRS